MVTLTIEKLHDAAWTVFGFQYEESIHDRDHFRAGLKRRLGSETASEVQRHVDAALGRNQIDTVNPKIKTRREFFELLALELAAEEIADKIEANAVFVDSDTIVPALGLSWSEDVVPLINGQGYLTGENVVRFLAMVRAAEQPVPSDEETEGRWRRLITFLERAIKMGEGVYCEL